MPVVSYAELSWTQVAELPRDIPLLIPLGQDDYDFDAAARKPESGDPRFLPAIPFGFPRRDASPAGESGRWPRPAAAGSVRCAA